MWSWCNEGAVPAFVWRDSARTASVPAKIPINHLPNTHSCLEHYCYTNLLIERKLYLNFWWPILLDPFQNRSSLVSTHVYKINGWNKGQPTILKPTANMHVHHLSASLYGVHCPKTQPLIHTFIEMHSHLLDRILYFEKNCLPQCWFLKNTRFIIQKKKLSL
jgi:hypothetical protein